MKLLSFLHRWTGGFLGLLLAMLGPHRHDPGVGRRVDFAAPRAAIRWSRMVQTIGRIAEREAAAGAIRITFASEEIGLHHVAKEGGAGSYVAQDGTTVASWSSQWERPELWMFDLHHHLFAGHTGETGRRHGPGSFGLLFVITGVDPVVAQPPRLSLAAVAATVSARPDRRPSPRHRHPGRAAAAGSASSPAPA